ncbi:MAG: sugar nucleotide-binding protein [Lachnospiraceae bacterium]|nr:sugar nucleotide-binding protein [Lachnospiraceae bacterium]
MDVILTGEYSYLMRALIDKHNKEGDHVFVISGSHYERDKFPKVYEQYDFAYDSTSMRQIVESINPDVVIFSGAFDTSFNWNLQQAEAVRYNTGLVNIMVALSSLSKKARIIYLSNQEIFMKSFEGDIKETDEPIPQGYKSMAISQGELTVMNYVTSMDMDVRVLRLGNLYGMPYNHIDLEPLIGRMTREGLEQGVITANPNHSFAMLHVSDAVDYIYQIATAEQPKEHLYNLSSCEEITEKDLADNIANGLGKNVRVDDKGVGSPYRGVFSNERFASEFRGKVFHHVPDEVPKIASLLKRNPGKYFFDGEEVASFAQRFKTKFGVILKAVLPFIENMIFFIPFFMINNRAVGSEFFGKLDVYLLYVLFFAIVYGQQQATFSALLATAGYLFRQNYTKSGLDIMLDYNTYVWIAQLFILGLVVGHMKDRLKVVQDENKDQIEYLNSQVSDITDINAVNVQMKSILEQQVINQNDSFGKVYSITSSLDQYAPEDVLFYAAEVLSQLVRSEDVAIYTVANRSYARLFAATSKKARMLGNSIEYPKMTDMYDEITKDRVYINRNMDNDYPLMADAITQDDEMQLILMVWGIPWDRMNLGQANMLRIAGYLIQNSVLRANRYMDALENTRYEGETDVLAVDAFTALVRAFTSAEQRDLTECCILKVESKGKGDEDAMAAAVGKTLRNSDYLGRLSDGGLYTLLSNTSDENAEYVINRIKGEGYRATIVKDLAL